MEFRTFFTTSVFFIVCLAGGLHAELIGHWKLDQSDGSAVIDSAGYGNNGVIVGNSVWEDGFHFDGSTSINVSGVLPYDGSSPHSWSVFVKHQMNTAGTIIARTSGGWIAGAKNLSVRPRIYFDNYGASSIIGTINTNDNQWHHIVFTYDGVNAKMYVDGFLDISTPTNLSQPSGDVRYPLIFGAGGAAGNYTGWMRDIRIYNHALSSIEVLNIGSEFKGAGSKPTIFYLNLTNTTSLPTKKQYDIRHVAACLQGLVNRNAPRVFISFVPEDAVWLNRLTEAGGLCEGWNIVEVASLEDMISRMKNFIGGVVLYDADPATGIISTSLVATTVAGVENGLAVRKDTGSGSLYNYLVQDASGPRFNILFDLTGKFTGSGIIWQSARTSTGSAKCDAYIWAKEKYIDTGRCDPTVLFYTLDLWGLNAAQAYPDRWQLTNLDYAVSRKAFCFELSPWGNEKPNDDPTQPLGTDLKTFKEIMNACNLQTGKTKMIKFCGFTNWWYKYTATAGGGGTHGDVETENETIKLQTAYNCYAETEAPGLTWISNSSFYGGLMPVVSERRYVQNPPPTYNEMVSRGLISASGAVVPGNYIMLAMDDYDSAAWILYWLAGDRYNSTSRGKTYCNWSITPSLCDRGSVAMDYMYRHKSSKDFFMGSVGYINPTQLYGSRSPSGYPSGVSLWQEHNREYFRLFDYSISGWLLNGSAGSLAITDCQNYAPFSGDGIGLHNQTGITKTLSRQSPVCTKEQYDDPSLSNIINNSSGVNFAWYRTTLWTPLQIRSLTSSIESSGFNRRCLDAYTYYYLLRYHLGGNNNYRATWLSDTIPNVMQTGQTYHVSVNVRNDGWDTWNEPNMYRLGYAIVIPGVNPSYTDYGSPRAYIPSNISVLPGQNFTFDLYVIPPSLPGTYYLYYDMVKDGVAWFRDQSNIEWKKKVVVTTNAMSIDTDSDGCPDIVEQANAMLYWNPDDGVSKNGDLNCDGLVNFVDVSILAQSWFGDDSSINKFPLTGDGVIGFEDFERIVSYWLTESY